MTYDHNNTESHKHTATVLHLAAELSEAEVRVVSEVVSRVRVEPAPELFQGVRQVPVVQRHHGPDAVRQQLVDEVVVVLKAWLAHVPMDRSPGQHARPRDGEPVVAHLQAQRDTYAIDWSCAHVLGRGKEG